MRSYPSDSPQAVSRLLALTVISDGGGSPPEIAATYRLSILDYARIDEDVFDQVLQELTADLPTTANGLVKVEAEMIDQCIGEIRHPELRLRVWEAMWELAYADNNVAYSEGILLQRAADVWGIELNANGSGRIVGANPT